MHPDIRALAIKEFLKVNPDAPLEDIQLVLEGVYETGEMFVKVRTKDRKIHDKYRITSVEPVIIERIQ